MNCMKCGREIEAGNVFCPECLAEMEKYPVKPGTVVQLPKRRETPAYKKATVRRRAVSLEEQIKKLRRAIRSLIVLLLICCVLIGFLLYPTLKPMLEETHFKPGQNYSSISSSPSEEALETLP